MGPRRQVGERFANHLLPPQVCICQGTLIDVQDQPVGGQDRDSIREAFQQIPIPLFVLAKGMLPRRRSDTPGLLCMRHIAIAIPFTYPNP